MTQVKQQGLFSHDQELIEGERLGAIPVTAGEKR
jgi:hypothetical protein